MYIFWNYYLHSQLCKIWWFLIFKIAELNEAKTTRILTSFFMGLGQDVLLSTLITMIKIFLENNNFKGCLSQSKVSRCSTPFLGSRTCPWTQISPEGIILDNKHDEPKVFWIFGTFGKFRNKIWVPPINNMCHTLWFIAYNS